MEINNCRNCSANMKLGQKICVNCGFEPLYGDSFCQQCGLETKTGQKICVNCGFELQSITSISEGKENIKRDNSGDSDAIFVIISFIFPFVGLILFLIWKDEHSKRSKSIGYASIIGLVIGFLLWVAYIS